MAIISIPKTSAIAIALVAIAACTFPASAQQAPAENSATQEDIQRGRGIVGACVIQARKDTPPAQGGYPFDAYVDDKGTVRSAPLTNGNKYTAFLFEKCVYTSGAFQPGK